MLPNVCRTGAASRDHVTDLTADLQASLGSSLTLDRELGGGGMSRVFLARDQRLDRTVVVKVLPPELVAGVSSDRFEREIRLAASLQHPNIVPLLSAGDVAGLPYYIMPYVEGDSLRARLSRGPLPIAEAVSVLRDVARALGYAHQRQVVHRDIKPDNVLLNRGAAVVTDFGIAKALSASRSPGEVSPTGALTVAGTSLGTPAYMAPEQIAGETVDARADVYAFGCMAYELLTGRTPFADLPQGKLLAAHLQQAVVPVMERRADAPPALAMLVMQCSPNMSRIGLWTATRWWQRSTARAQGRCLPRYGPRCHRRRWLGSLLLQRPPCGS
jgi:eukaryotic-like serine/threonine-protein kinase